MAYHSHLDKPVFELVTSDKNVCPWCMRAWVIAVHAGLPFKETTVKFRQANTAEQIRKHSPTGKVPVIKQKDLTVWDSLAIAEYLNDLSPEAQLWPANPQWRALARSYAAEVHSGFGKLHTLLRMNYHMKPLPEFTLWEAQPEIERMLQMWKDALKLSKGPYLFGDFSIADAFFAPNALMLEVYGITLKDKALKQYIKNLKDHHGISFWIAEAKKEKPYVMKF